jgi:agmatine/peptidylarginine deiminase
MIQIFNKPNNKTDTHLANMTRWRREKNQIDKIKDEKKSYKYKFYWNAKNALKTYIQVNWKGRRNG